jgi:hypothetical protein
MGTSWSPATSILKGRRLPPIESIRPNSLSLGTSPNPSGPNAHGPIRRSSYPSHGDFYFLFIFILFFAKIFVQMKKIQKYITAADSTSGKYLPAS